MKKGKTLTTLHNTSIKMFVEVTKRGQELLEQAGKLSVFHALERDKSSCG